MSVKPKALVELSPGDLDQLMPMHLRLNEKGRITGVGSTLQKVLGMPLIGRDLFTLFRFRRPWGIGSVADLASRPGQRLKLCPVDAPEDMLRGLAIPLASGGILLNLSFGIGIVDAVRRHALTDADFVATDLTVELLYLAEVNALATQGLMRLNDRLKGARDQAEEQALTDTLTGLRNRRAADIGLGRMVDAASAYAVMSMDLDYFKAVNDTHGHGAGDHVLRQVGAILSEETRATDIAARIGGDEFQIILPTFTDAGALLRLARRIIARVMEPMSFEGADLRVSASIGIAIAEGDDETPPDVLISRADEALYASKRAGRSCARVWGQPAHFGTARAG